jgi:hypothetical protein
MLLSYTWIIGHFKQKWLCIETENDDRDLLQNTEVIPRWNIVQDSQLSNYTGLKMTATCFFALEHNDSLWTKPF